MIFKKRRRFVARAKSLGKWVLLPTTARREVGADKLGPPLADPGPEAVIEACLLWIARAQDMSASADGGVARDYSLISGWSTSYPETTGYIVPTVLQCADACRDAQLLERGRRMLNWLVSIQFPEGGFMGGKINDQPRVPVTFNTGQILMGLSAGVRALGELYREPMNRAASWLRDTLDSDGCWRCFPTPFASPGDKTYETHVSRALFEAARLEPEKGYGEAGLRNVEWALTNQDCNGWFANCCLSNPNAPLTHTIGYTIQGIIDAYLYSGRKDLLSVAEITANGVMKALHYDGYIPGRLGPGWHAATDYACLTGTAQLAICWLLLYRETGNSSYLNAASVANSYVRRTIHMTGNPDIVGGVKGSFPIDGEYCSFQFPNWATKFCIDANLLELEMRKRSSK